MATPAPSGPAQGTPIKRPTPPDPIDWSKLFAYWNSGPPGPGAVVRELTIGGAVAHGDTWTHVYGKRLVEGKVIQKRNYGGTWYVLVSICKGPIHKVNSVRLDDIGVLSSGPVTYTINLGGYDQAADSVASSVWGTSFKWPGYAYAVFAFDYNVSFENISRFTFEVEGFLVYDHRSGRTVSRARAANVATIVTSAAHGRVAGDVIYLKGMGASAYDGTHTIVSAPTTTSFTFANTGSNEGTTADTAGKIRAYSTNPVVCMRHMLTDKVAGGKTADALINETSWDAGADACDVLVAGEKKFVMNWAISSKASVEALLQTARGSCAAEIYKENGLYCVRVDVEQTTPVIAFDTRTNCRDVKITELATENRPTRVTINFKNAASAWTPDLVRSEDPGLRDESVPLRPAEYTFDNVTDVKIAHRLATYLRLFGTLAPLRVSFTCSPVGALLQRGQLNTLTSRDLVAQEILIEDFQELANGEFFVTAREHDSAVYDETALTPGTPPSTNASSPFTVPDVTCIQGAASGSASNVNQVWWDPQRNYLAATLYGTSYWTNSGFGNYDGTKVNDGITNVRAFDVNVAVAATLTLHVPAGARMGKVKIFGSALNLIATDFVYEYSDDGASWTYAPIPYSSALEYQWQPFTGSPWTSVVVEWDDAGSHPYWRIRRLLSGAVACDVYEVQFYEFDELYLYPREFEIHSGLDPSGPVIMRIPADKIPTSSAPLDLASFIVEAPANSLGYVIQTLDICVVAISKLGIASAGVYRHQTWGSWAAPYVAARTAAGATPQVATHSAIDGSASQTILDLPGISAPSVSASGAARLYAVVTTGVLMLSTSAGAFKKLLTDAIGVLLQSSSPGTTQTGHIHVSGTIRAGAKVWAEGDLVADAQSYFSQALSLLGATDSSFGLRAVGQTLLGRGTTGRISTIVDTNAEENIRPAGEITMTGRTTPDTGWLFCDGSAVSRTGYADLFNAISTTFGVGDGSTTFNLPDLRGRFPLGLAASGTGSTLGGTGGAIDHTHDVDIAATTSGVESTDQTFQQGAGASLTVAAQNHTHSTNPASTTSTTANPPFQAVNFMIKT